ncbi:hypothetical protein [Halobellus ruber]|uniref:Uncharacterized protein n=1 Tax=Halobellus ruber TaxID=2761102 RepID=A0A7J9SNM3_9EURY|nr:hypothetical protein [Halobellus ruber]MBB6647737.1 hypothetical protein [Halobellus ruber]
MPRRRPDDLDAVVGGDFTDALNRFLGRRWRRDCLVVRRFASGSHELVEPGRGVRNEHYRRLVCDERVRFTSG